MSKIRLLPFLASMMAASAAFSQSNTVYGLIDTGIEYVTNVGSTSASVLRMPNLSGSLPSRIGFKGTEPIGDRLRLSYVLEAGFSPDSGASNQGGRLFGRQAFLSLETGEFSTALGRQYSMLFLALSMADQLGPNTFGLGSHDAYIPNAREDNSISAKWTSDGWAAGATYSLGRDTINAGPSPSGTNCAGENSVDTSACKAWSAMLRLDQKTYGWAVATDTITGGNGAYAGLTSSDKKDRRLTVNGYTFFGSAKIAAGVISRANDGAAALSPTNGQSRRSHLIWVSGMMPLTGSISLEGQAQKLAYLDGGDASYIVAARINYALSKRSTVYATAGRVENKGRLSYSISSGQSGSNPSAGEGQSGLMVGVRHQF